jgi:hypothetical protein
MNFCNLYIDIMKLFIKLINIFLDKKLYNFKTRGQPGARMAEGLPGNGQQGHTKMPPERER